MMSRSVVHYAVSLDITAMMFSSQPAGIYSKAEPLAYNIWAPTYDSDSIRAARFDPGGHCDCVRAQNALVAVDVDIVAETIQANGLADLAVCESCQNRSTMERAVAFVAGTIVGVTFKFVSRLQSGCARILCLETTSSREIDRLEKNTS